LGDWLLSRLERRKDIIMDKKALAALAATPVTRASGSSNKTWVITDTGIKTGSSVGGQAGVIIRALCCTRWDGNQLSNHGNDQQNEGRRPIRGKYHGGKGGSRHFFHRRPLFQ